MAVLLLLAAHLAANSQSWERSVLDASIASVQPQADNSLLVSGWAYDSSGNRAGWLATTYRSGVVIWQNSIATSQGGVFNAAARAPDGAIVAVGYTGPSDSAVRSGWILKFDANGALLWQKQISSGPRTTLASVTVADDGSIVAVGGRWTSDGDRDALVVKLSSSGVLLSEFLVQTASNERFYEVQRTADGGFVAAGETATGLGDTDVWIVKFDANLNIEWQRAFGGANSDAFGGFAVAPDGGFCVGMTTASFGATDTDALVLRLTSSGAAMWARRFEDPASGGGAESLTSVAAASDGGCYITGAMRFTLSGSGASNFLHLDWLARLGADGAVVWQGSRGFDSVQSSSGQGVWALSNGLFLTTHSRYEHVWQQTLGLMRADIFNSCTGLFTGFTPFAPSVNSIPTSASGVGSGLALFDSAAGASAGGAAHELSCLGRPLEVSAPGSPQPLRFASRTTLVWEDAIASNSATFNLRRGVATNLAAGDYGDCLRSGIPSATAVDADTPDPGECFTYLVTGRDAAGEGPLGRTSTGAPRSNLHLCP